MIFSQRASGSSLFTAQLLHSVLVADVVLVDQHGEGREVEEEADVEDADELVDVVQELEIALVLRSLFNKSLEHGAAENWVQAQFNVSTFWLGISSITGVVHASQSRSHSNFSEDTFVLGALVKINFSQLILLALKSIHDCFSLEFHGSSVDRAELLANDFMDRMLKQGLGIEVVKGSQGGHGGVAE